MSRLRDKLTYANVVATLALFIALGGSSYAALTITGKNVKNGSITGKDIKRNGLGTRQINERRLGIRYAVEAGRLGGYTARDLLVQCPDATLPAGGTCVEIAARPAEAFGGAATQCSGTDSLQDGVGRRVPTYGELNAALNSDRITLAPGGELTSEVLDNGSGQLQVTYITAEGGLTGLTPNTFEGGKAYRCAADPLN